MEEYECGEVLGRGAFGAAYKVTRKRDHSNFVIKKVDVSRMPEEEKKETKREVLIMQKLAELCDHPNIVAYYDSFLDKDSNQLCIVMEYADAGALSDIVKENKNAGTQLPLKLILQLFTQLVLAVRAMHDVKPAGILHRDLKTQNVFLKREAQSGRLDVKLGDFGLSKSLKEDEMAKTIVGTPYNLAPELCQGLSYAKPVDVWALGCVLYEITTTRHAFEGSSLPALVMKIMRGLCPSVRERRYFENGEHVSSEEPSETEMNDAEEMKHAAEDPRQVIEDIDDLISRCLKGEPVRCLAGLRMLPNF
jgi:serine/threonine protein kinase